MLIEILSPDKKIYNGKAVLLQLPGVDGSFEILENHAPMVSLLTNGNLRLVDDNKKEFVFEIRGGMCEVQKNKIIVLAE